MPGCYYRCFDWKQMEVTYYKKSVAETMAVQRASKGSGRDRQKVLTDSLRSMEEDGLITRTVYPEVPPRVEYALSDLGKSLKPILDSMVAWGNSYKNM